MNIPDFVPAGGASLSDQFISAASEHEAQGQAILASLREIS